MAVQKDRKPSKRNHSRRGIIVLFIASMAIQPTCTRFYGGIKPGISGQFVILRLDADIDRQQFAKIVRENVPPLALKKMVLQKFTDTNDYPLYPLWLIGKNLKADAISDFSGRLQKALPCRCQVVGPEKVSFSKPGVFLADGYSIALQVNFPENDSVKHERVLARIARMLYNRFQALGPRSFLIAESNNFGVLCQIPKAGAQHWVEELLVVKNTFVEFKLLEEPVKIRDIFNAIDLRSRAENGGGQPGLLQYLKKIGEDYGVTETDSISVGKILSSDSGLVPPEDQILFGASEEWQGHTVRRVYLVKRAAEMAGVNISSARCEMYQGHDPAQHGTWIVNVKLSKDETWRFARVTGDTVGKRLAIVLNGIVQMAPVVRDRIVAGQLVITTGDRTYDKARDLARTLRTGSLPAPVTVGNARPFVTIIQ